MQHEKFKFLILNSHNWKEQIRSLAGVNWCSHMKSMRLNLLLMWKRSASIPQPAGNSDYTYSFSKLLFRCKLPVGGGRRVGERHFTLTSTAMSSETHRSPFPLQQLWHSVRSCGNTDFCPFLAPEVLGHQILWQAHLNICGPPE